MTTYTSPKLSRRSAVLSGVAATAMSTRVTKTMASTDINGIPFTVAALGRALRKRDLTAVSIAEAVVLRSETLATLGTFTSINPDQLIADARHADALFEQGQNLGPLQGIPVALKDNIDAVGHATTGGTPALRNNFPKTNAPVTQRLLDAGAIVAGKVNMHELAGGGTTNNPSYLRTRNPYAPNHSPGGSSGGSAVAVSARIVPAALGTDTAGSVCNPAAYCGVSGFRPTLDRYPSAGIVPLSLTRDTAGPLAHTVDDIVTLDAALAADSTPVQAANLAGMRIGIPKIPFRDNTTPDIQNMMADVERILREAGATLVDAEIPNLVDFVNETSLITLGGRIRQDLTAYLSAGGSPVSFNVLAEQIADPFVKGWMTPFLNPSADILNEEARVARDVIPVLRRTYTAFLKDNALDAIVFPTTPTPAGIEVPGTEDIIVDGERIPEGIWLNIQNTGPATLWGGPGISLPAGLSGGGLPISIELNGAIKADKALFGLALAIEKLLPDTPPPA
jgi:indoleacetamide hydrolase